MKFLALNAAHHRFPSGWSLELAATMRRHMPSGAIADSLQDSVAVPMKLHCRVMASSESSGRMDVQP